MALAALLTAGPALAADPPTAEEALARQKASLHQTLGLDCKRGRAADDIVICGRSGRDPNRLPLDPEPEPGARLVGEPVRPEDALANTAPPTCSTVGPNQRCGGGLPVIPIAIWLVQTAIKAAKSE
jgi:hypothetical protein